jgi:hypothetical protein
VFAKSDPAEKGGVIVGMSKPGQVGAMMQRDGPLTGLPAPPDTR